MENFRTRTDVGGSNILGNGRNSASRSKMKVERLKLMLQDLKNGEQQSKQRNEHLLEDFDKVNKLAENFDDRARKLKRVKQEYETYINKIYPHWKENVEAIKKQSTKSPLEDLELSQKPSYVGRPDRSAQYEDEKSQVQSPMRQNSAHLVSDRFINKNVSTNAYGSHPHNLHNLWFDCSDGTRNNANAGSYHSLEGKERVVNFSSGPLHESSIRNSSSLRSQGRDRDEYYSSAPFSQGQSHFPYHTECKDSVRPARPDYSKLPRVDRDADISSFTVLPQALAFSPDGRLVLLPMTFSPELSLPRDSAVGINMAGRAAETVGRMKDSRDEFTRNGSHEKVEIGSEDAVGQDLIKGTSITDERFKTRKDSSARRSVVQHHDLNEIDRKRSMGNAKDERQEVLNGFRDKQKYSDYYVDKSREDYDATENKNFKLEESNYDFMNADVGRINHKTRNLPSNGEGEDSDEPGCHNGTDRKQAIEEGLIALSESDLKNHTSLGPAYSATEDYDEGLNDIALNMRNEKQDETKDKGIGEFHENGSGKVDQNRNYPAFASSSKDNHFESSTVPTNNRLTADSDFIVPTKESTVLILPDLEPSKIDSRATKVQEERQYYNENTVESKENSQMMDQSRNFDTEESRENDMRIAEDNREIFFTDTGHQKEAADTIESKYDEKSVESSATEVEKRVKVMDVPEISNLFEEIENRMEDSDPEEFYRKATGDLKANTLDEIKKVLLSNGNLDYFATSDLCVVSRLAVAEFVKMNSIDGCMIASDEIVSSIYTLDDCREKLSREFEELWEYVFNHLELLAANEIFKVATVCEMFSQLLCPGNSVMAVELSHAIQRIMDGTDEDVIYQNEEEYSSGTEELISIEGGSNREDVLSPDHSALIVENESRETSVSIASPVEEPKYYPNLNSGEPQKSPVFGKQASRGSADKGKVSGEIIKDDLSLDLGSVSNDDDDYEDGDVGGNGNSDDDDDDDDSTFDSAKLTPHKTPQKVLRQSNTSKSEASSTAEEETGIDETVSEASSRGMPTDEKSNNNKSGNVVENDDDADDDGNDPDDDDNDHASDDDLEDLLSSSLVLDGARNKKDVPAYEPTFNVSKKAENKSPALFMQKQDSFEADESQPVQKIKETTGKAIFSPTNSKAVSSKFRKPGFWENSDTESEAGDFNISAGNNPSVPDDNEDEFDFGFYN